jgi:hypothetical protein
MGASPCADRGEFSHAALIPKGIHAGKVLLWRVELIPIDPPGAGCTLGNTTEVWLFDPTNPSELIHVQEPPNPAFSTNIFCAGASWDQDGRLLVVGGFNGSTATSPVETYRFRPEMLPPVTSGAPCPAGTGPFITVSPDAPVWVQVGSTVIPRYYPTVMALGRTSIDFSSSSSTCGSIQIAGGSNLVLGGPPLLTTEGNEFWNAMPAGAGATQWYCPVIQTPSTSIHATQYLQGSAPRDIYALKSSTATLPEPRLDSYPRVFQLSTLDLLIAGDVDTVGPNDPRYYNNCAVNPNEAIGAWAAPGDWWSMKP